MGKFITASGPEEKLQYILTVLKHTELNQPDYQGIAKETGQSSANNAQKKFRAYIQQAGFKLVDRQVVDADGGEGDKGEAKTKTVEASTPNPKRKGSTSAGTATSTPSKAKTSAKKPAIQQTPSKTQKENPDTGRSAKKRKVVEILLSSDEEEEEQEVNTVEEVTDGIKTEVHQEQEIVNDAVSERTDTDTDDDLDIDEDGDRFRRSRARSMTMKAEAV